MIGKFLKNMTKISINIPYNDGLVYPTEAISKVAIAEYCTKEKFEYEFIGKNEDNNIIVKIDGRAYEVIRGLAGIGGYGIICRAV